MQKIVHTWQKPRPAQKAPEMGASLTVPDQSMDMRTLLERHARGMPLDVKGGIKQPQYYNGEFPDISKLDISEVEQLKRHAAQQVEDYKNSLTRQEEERRTVAQNKLHAEIEKLKQQLQTQNNSSDDQFTAAKTAL